MTAKHCRTAILMIFWVAAVCLKALPGWGLPAAFTDDMGREVVLETRAYRVVSLVPSVTEILFRIGAGDSVVGVTYHNTYPPETVLRPIIGGFFNPNIERIKALKPDIIFYARLQQNIVADLAAGPWQLINLEMDSISDSFDKIRLLGRMFGRAPAAAALIAENEKQLDLIARKTARIPRSARKRVMRLMGREKLMVPGDDSFQYELIRAAGGIPPKLGRTGAVVEMTRSEFMAFDPQVIYGCGGDRQAADALFQQAGYREVSAVKNNRIYYFPCSLTCRVATGTGYFVNWLSARIYRESYADPTNQIQPDGVLGHRNLTIDLDYIKSARIERSRIADFHHKTLIIDFNAPLTVLSTLEGRRCGITTIGNHYSPPPYWGIGHQHGLDRIRSTILAASGRSGAEVALLLTGADMERLAVQQASFKDLTVWALVTGGVRSNAVRTSRDEGRYYEPGTINILLLTNAKLSARAMSRAVITATEAKSAALADMDIRSAYRSQRYQATGTGTDNIIVAEGRGVPIDLTGGHSKMGELIAQAVYRGVREALYLQNGLVGERHVFARLLERQISVHGLVSQAACDCVPDTSLVGRELEALLLDARYAGFLEAAFSISDDYEAGLIADTQAFEHWCRAMASEIAGQPLADVRALIQDDTMPRIQKMALNALLNGLYSRLTLVGGTP